MCNDPTYPWSSFVHIKGSSRNVGWIKQWDMAQAFFTFTVNNHNLSAKTDIWFSTTWPDSADLLAVMHLCLQSSPEEWWHELFKTQYFKKTPNFVRMGDHYFWILPAPMNLLTVKNLMFHTCPNFFKILITGAYICNYSFNNDLQGFSVFNHIRSRHENLIEITWWLFL